MEFDPTKKLTRENFAELPPLCTDGAWGTELQKHSLPAGSPPELWNIENPDAVLAVARSYVEAGSEVILTNTFGANRFVLASHGLGGRTTELAEKGAAISRKAAGEEIKVFASMGPSGKIIMMGDASQAELSDAFAEAAAALERGGVDAIVLETFNELEEMKVALAAVVEAVAVPVVTSMTFASGPEGVATMMGDSPAALAAAAEAGGAAAVGANCGTGPANYVRVVGLLQEATDLPIWAKANAGLPQHANGQTHFPMSAEEYATFVPELVEAGADFIGGCCGTSPEFVRAIRAAVDALPRR